MTNQKTLPACVGGTVTSVDLEDFPHGDFLAGAEGLNGRIDYHAALPGTKVIAMDAEGVLTWADAAYWSKHYAREIEIVNLTDGRQIITDDDSRAVFGIDPNAGGFEFLRDTPTNAKARGIVIPVIQDTGSLFDVSADCTPVRDVQVTTEDVPFARITLDREFGWFLGAMAGDGWWDKRDFTFWNIKAVGATRTVKLSDNLGFKAARALAFLKTMARTDKFYYYVKTSLKADHPDRYGDTKCHTFAFPRAELFTRFLSEHLGGERDNTTSGAANKRLPVFTFAAPKEFRLGMLCGLIDTDGSVSIAGLDGRENSQLHISFTSTSLRLVREMQLLARTLGIRSTISHGRNKTNDTEYWLLSVSSVDCRKAKALDGLTAPHKREAYMTAVIDETHVCYDGVVLPTAIGIKLQSGLCPGKDRTDPYNKRQFASYTSIRKAIKEGNVLARKALDQALADIRCEQARVVAKITLAKTTLTSLLKVKGVLTDDLRLTILAGMTAAAPSYGDKELNKRVINYSAAMRQWLKKGRPADEREALMLEWLESLPPPACVIDDPDVAAYLAFVADRNVAWTTIADVVKTGRREDGYDLTVPGFETFMTTDGVILSNTTNFHVPVTDKAAA